MVTAPALAASNAEQEAPSLPTKAPRLVSVDIVRGLVAELSDQNAYRRYLTFHGFADSPTAWRAFQDERWAAKSRRGRCC